VIQNAEVPELLRNLVRRRGDPGCQSVLRLSVPS
jgi:hypothetical protein